MAKLMTHYTDGAHATCISFGHGGIGINQHSVKCSLRSRITGRRKFPAVRPDVVYITCLFLALALVNNGYTVNDTIKVVIIFCKIY